MKEQPIVNKVANSKLITFDLEDIYPKGGRTTLDISSWLLEGFLLKEKDFREKAKNHNWEQYKGTYLALSCSTDAIIPAWAYLLLTSYAAPFAKKVIQGSLKELETVLYTEAIACLDLEYLKDAPVIIKGCSQKPVPENAYLLLIQRIQPYAKSIFYGEACSSVPLFKRK